MPHAAFRDVRIEYETLGEPGGPPLLLIMGLGRQLLGWHQGFCDKLAAHGLRLVRYDNRDVGLSTKWEQAGMPDLGKVMEAYLGGGTVEAPYLLSDMAADAVGLLDALGIERAHVCGISMGGMIGQTLAIEHPGRVASLVSMESTTGEADLPGATPEAVEALLRTPPAGRDGYVEHMVEVFRVFAAGSDLYDEEREREISVAAYDRCFYPEGFVRQLTAIVASGGRREALRRVAAPTLVLHGSRDPLVPPAHGEDTAAAVPGARFVPVAGLGHGLSYPALWDTLAAEIAGHVRSASS